MPAHTHVVNASTTASNQSNTPTGNIFGPSNVVVYHTAANSTLIPTEVTSVGGSQPHENRQPFLVLNFCIALQGIFPSRN